MVVNNSEADSLEQSNQSSSEEVLDSTLSGKETDTASEESEREEESEESFMGKGFDPNSLKDPNLKKAYKQMQANWTKKNQDFSKISKETESLKEWKKNLESNPYFQSWANEMAVLASGQKQQNFDSMSEEQRISYLVDQKLNAILESKINPRVDNLEAERASSRVDKFLAENPEAKNYASDIAKVMKAHPTLSLNDAWKFVGADFAKDEAQKKVRKEISLKERANLELPGKQTSQPVSKKRMSVEEALELAERQTGYKL